MSINYTIMSYTPLKEYINIRKPINLSVIAQFVYVLNVDFKITLINRKRVRKISTQIFKKIIRQCMRIIRFLFRLEEKDMF